MQDGEIIRRIYPMKKLCAKTSCGGEMIKRGSYGTHRWYACTKCGDHAKVKPIATEVWDARTRSGRIVNLSA